MTLILVVGTEAGTGATTVATGLAQRFTSVGQNVRVERLSDGSDVGRAEEDAKTFGSLETGSGCGKPLRVEELSSPDGTLILEAPIGTDGISMARELGAKLVLVKPSEGAGVDAIDSSAVSLKIETRSRNVGSGLLPEDRILAAPRVSELIEASDADVLSRSEQGEMALCEHIVVGAISHDAADSYFERFPRSAVVTRNGRVDLAIAAIAAGATCLILSGGGEPSPYILDRAAASRDTTLMVTSGDTPSTVHAIEGTFGTSPFSGEAKIMRTGELMQDTVPEDILERLLV